MPDFSPEDIDKLLKGADKYAGPPMPAPAAKSPADVLADPKSTPADILAAYKADPKAVKSAMVKDSAAAPLEAAGKKGAADAAMAALGGVGKKPFLTENGNTPDGPAPFATTSNELGLPPAAYAALKAQGGTVDPTTGQAGPGMAGGGGLAAKAPGNGTALGQTFAGASAGAQKLVPDTVTAYNAGGGVPGGFKPGGVSGGGMPGAGGPPKPWDPASMFSPGEKALYATQGAEMDLQNNAAAASAEAMAEGKHHEAVKLKLLAEQQEIDAAEAAEREAERQRYIKERLDLQEQAAEALSKEKIDPDRLWAQKSGGDRVGAMIAIFAAGIGGQGQNVLDMFQRKIDSDIDAQKANLKNKWNGLEAQKGLLAQRVALFGDERQAEASAQASYWQQIQTQFQGIAASTAYDVEKINAEKGAQMAALEADKWKQQLVVTAEQRKAAEDAAKAKAQAAAAGAAMSDMKEKKKAAYDIAVADIKKNGGEIQWNAQGFPYIVRDGKTSAAIGESAAGGGGATATVFGPPNAAGQPTILGNAPAKSKEAATKLDDQGKAYADLMSTLARVQKHIDEKGTTYNPWGSAAAESDALQAEVFTKVKKFAEGMSSDNDAKLLMKMVPEPGAFFSGAQIAKLQALKDKATGDYANATKAYLAPSAQPTTLQLGAPK